MADVITRSLEETENKIKSLNKELRSTGNQLKDIKQNIKLDGGNIDLIKQKYSLLNKELDKNNQKIALYKEKQKKLEDLLKDGAITEKQYISRIETINSNIEKTQKNVEKLTEQIALQNKELSNAKWTNFNNGLDKFQNVAQKASKVALVLYGAMTGIVASFVKTADEIEDTSKKLNTSVEKLQLGRNIYEKLAGGANEYDSALSSLSSSMTSIASGRGTRYISVLNQLGIAYKDIANLDTGSQLQQITNALKNITDETTRTSLAMVLFGESGRSVSVIAGQSATEINKYNQELINSGLITAEQSKTANDLANKFDSIKKSLSVVSGELVVALMPTIEILTDLLKNDIIPILNSVATAISNISPTGQKILLIIGMAIVFLPKVIGLIKGIGTVVALFGTKSLVASGGVGALGLSMTGLQPAIIAVVTAMILLITIIAIFTNSVDKTIDKVSDLTKDMTDMSKLADNMNTEVATSSSTITEQNSTKTVNMNLDIYGHGDTDVSDDSAKAVAINFIDLLQNELGGLIN